MIHRPYRRTLRLANYDYRQAGAYFVTVVVHQRECHLGKVENQAMILNPYGKIVLEELERTPRVRTGIALEGVMVMPNHFHCIFLLEPTENFGIDVSADMNRASQRPAPTLSMPTNAVPNSLGSIIGHLKATTTKRIRKAGLLGFGWQRGYHEHIIRDSESFERIHLYISSNPQTWLEDRINPSHSDPWVMGD